MMPTLFDAATRDAVLARIEGLQAGAERQWGTMSPPQMLEHAARVLELATGRRPEKRRFIGRILGPVFFSSFVGPAPFRKDAPTGAAYIVRDTPDMAAVKRRVVELVHDLHAQGERGCEGRLHPFFGTLTGAQWGITQFKHLDHHLRQFGA